MSGLFGRRISHGIFGTTLALLSGCESPVQFSQPIGEPIPLLGTKFEGANYWNFDQFGPSGPENPSPSCYTKQIRPDEFALSIIFFDGEDDGKDTVHRAFAKIHKIKDFAYEEGVHVLVIEIFRGLRHSRGGNWSSEAGNCEVGHSDLRKDCSSLDNQGFRLARNLSGESKPKSPSGMEISSYRPEIRMVRVEGGTFPAGSKFSGAEIKEFEIGAFEVTWDQWRAVHEWGLKNGYTRLPDWRKMTEFHKGSSGSHPVRRVSWQDAVLWSNALSEMEGMTPAYVNELTDEVYKGQGNSSLPRPDPEANGYRLPTGAEWEWAARGGTKGGGHAYSGASDLKEVAWYRENSAGEESGPRAVGGKKANELGIFDMSGNVEEWCEDSQKQYMYFLMTSPYEREVAFYWINDNEILKDARAGRISVNGNEPPFWVTANKTETEKYIQENRPRLFSVIEPIIAKWVGGSEEKKPGREPEPSKRPDSSVQSGQAHE